MNEYINRFKKLKKDERLKRERERERERENTLTVVVSTIDSCVGRFNVRINGGNVFCSLVNDVIEFCYM